MPDPAPSPVQVVVERPRHEAIALDRGRLLGKSEQQH
jgi:hypothetical protein